MSERASGYWWVFRPSGWELIEVDGERTWIMGSEESCPLRAYQDATTWVRVATPDEQNYEDPVRRETFRCPVHYPGSCRGTP
jgi:hypothetical protein